MWDLEPWSEHGIVGHEISSLNLDTGWLLIHSKIMSTFFPLRGILVGYQDSYLSPCFFFFPERTATKSGLPKLAFEPKFHTWHLSHFFADWPIKICVGSQVCCPPSALSRCLSQSSVCCQNHGWWWAVGESQLRSLSWGNAIVSIASRAGQAWVELRSRGCSGGPGRNAIHREGWGWAERLLMKVNFTFFNRFF